MAFLRPEPPNLNTEVLALALAALAAAVVLLVLTWGSCAASVGRSAVDVVARRPAAPGDLREHALQHGSDPLASSLAGKV